MAARVGISRVTDITRLDRVGVPVCASIRPGARAGSLCVNAGKGLVPLEAKVGVYMEAIEFACAELGNSHVRPLQATARDILDGRTRPEAILDFCPVVGASIELNAPLMCVEAEELVSSGHCLIPSELVFHPYDPALGSSYFGSSTNGLSSGNSVLEASVHALSEVIERDVRSFHSIKDTSAIVKLGSLPISLARVLRDVSAANLIIFVRYLDNVFQLPCFATTVADEGSTDPIYVSGGYACHPSKEIAVTRSICEALQSRLSFIHGAREDLVDHYARFAGMDSRKRADYARDLVAQVSTAHSSLEFAEIPDCEGALDSIESSLDILVSSLRSAGMRKICRVTFTTPQDPLQVIRMVVPGLEFFTAAAPRFGLRLSEYVRES